MGKPIRLISLPYDSAHFDKRMGAGPSHIISNGLIQKLETGGNEVYYNQIVAQKKFTTEIATSFELLDLLRSNIQDAVQNKYFPIVLSGNCIATVGVMAGLASNRTGVIWLDAHGDCETPETTTSGFLDGMGIAVLLNSCWQNVLAAYALHSPLPGKNIVLAGARDVSAHEKQFISENGINYVTVNEAKLSNNNRIKDIVAQFIDAGIRHLHLHVDVDVIDPCVAPSNSYAVEGGLNKTDTMNLIGYCLRAIPISSLTIASYDPSLDTNGAMLTIINDIIEMVIRQYNKNE